MSPSGPPLQTPQTPEADVPGPTRVAHTKIWGLPLPRGDNPLG